MTSPLMPNYQTYNEKTMPSEVSPRLYGSQTQSSLFRLQTGDIISLCTNGGSKLQQWLPARPVTNWFEPIAHLSWVAPEGFDGSQSYADYLVDRGPVEECEFGDGTVYQMCEYDHTMARVTWSTRNEPIKAENLGMKLWERTPQHVLRGDTTGLVLTNDRDWSLARLSIAAEEHMNWNILFGDENGIPNTYQGFNAINSVGWVKSRAKGKGSCDFTDPVVMSGVDLTTPKAIARRLAAIITKVRRRMTSRNYTPSGDDMIVVMNPIMWDHLADAIAYGALTTYFSTGDVTINVTPETVQRERDRIKNGGLGEGFIPMAGYNVPVITDANIGHSSTLSNGDPAITGDIQILCKKFRGITILEQHYLDWSKMPNSPFQVTNGGGYTPAYFQGNMIRVVPVRVNGLDLCWYYGADMYGRIVSYMNMLQGRLNDVTIAVDIEGEFEAPSFTSENWWAYDGEVGGAGNSILQFLS